MSNTVVRSPWAGVLGSLLLVISGCGLFEFNKSEDQELGDLSSQLSVAESQLRAGNRGACVNYASICERCGNICNAVGDVPEGDTCADPFTTDRDDFRNQSFPCKCVSVTTRCDYGLAQCGRYHGPDGGAADAAGADGDVDAGSAEDAAGLNDGGDGGDANVDPIDVDPGEEQQLSLNGSIAVAPGAPGGPGLVIGRTKEEPRFIQGLVMNAAGTTLQGPFKISTAGDANKSVWEPRLAGAGDGSFLAVWVERLGVVSGKEKWALQAARIRISGNTASASTPKAIASGEGLVPNSPSLAYASGVYLVTWRQDNAILRTGTNSAAYVSATEEAINATPLALNWPPSLQEGTALKVGSNGTQFMLAWSSFLPYSGPVAEHTHISRVNVQAVRVNPDNTLRLGAGGLVAALSTRLDAVDGVFPLDSFDDASVVGNPATGNFLVTWKDNELCPNNPIRIIRVAAQLVDAKGEDIGKQTDRFLERGPGATSPTSFAGIVGGGRQQFWTAEGSDLLMLYYTDKSRCGSSQNNPNGDSLALATYSETTKVVSVTQRLGTLLLPRATMRLGDRDLIFYSPSVISGGPVSVRSYVVGQ